MEPTEDTPRERDHKADVLKLEREQKAEEHQSETREIADEVEAEVEIKADVLWKYLYKFRWEVRGWFFAACVIAYLSGQS